LNRYCISCGKEIEGTGRMFSFDRPYLNLYFHKECIPESEEEIKKYVLKLQENKSFCTKKHKVWYNRSILFSKQKLQYIFGVYCLLIDKYA
jgi:hypothetical protein